MRDIKFEYLFACEQTNEIKKSIFTLEELENTDMDSYLENLDENFYSDSLHSEEDGEVWRILERRESTGLKDKHGKMIFEGDILSVWRAGSNRIFTVKWRESGVPMYILYPQPMNEDFWQCRSDMEMSWEIIGNVFEHPELLKS